MVGVVAGLRLLGQGAGLCRTWYQEVILHIF